MGTDGTPAPASSELKLRVLAGSVMAVAAIVATGLGGGLFVAFWALACLAVGYEWQRLIGGPALALRTGCVFAGALLVAIGASQPTFALIPIGFLLAAMAGLWQSRDKRLDAVTGAFYATMPLAAVILCRGTTYDGLIVILWLFAIVWGTDVFAYFTGRALGGPKLWPRVSPKKTWSGALGGLLAAMILGSLVLVATGYGFRLRTLVLAALLSVATQAGDLFESSLKRRYDVKDSGHLIPGHGGFMDRLDGFIIAVVVAALIGSAVSGPDQVAQGLIGR